jgi:hypothetical protein
MPQHQEQHDALAMINFLGYVNIAASDAEGLGNDAEHHHSPCLHVEKLDPKTFLSHHLPKGSPAYNIERCTELHRISMWRDAMRRKRTVAVDPAHLNMAALLTALPDIQERRGTINVTSRPLRGRSQHMHGSREGREEEGDRNSTSAYGSCHAAVGETQTEAESFRQAAQKWRGEFSVEALIRRCDDCTHPSFPVTWRRVIRASGVAPGKAQSDLRKQVRYYCDACLICQKLQPAREHVAARKGSIKKGPFQEYAFDVIVLNASDVDDNRYIY